MREVRFLILVVLAVAGVACANEGDVTAAGPLRATSAQPPASDDGGGEAASRTAIVTGDFDGYKWELVVEDYEALGPCLVVQGEPLPQEGDQLSAGSCMGPLEGLQWSSTSAGVGTVVIGHAPTETATVEFRDGAGGSTQVSALYAHETFPHVRFFIERVGDGAAPVEVAALDDAGEVLATQPLLSAEPLASDQPLTDDPPAD